MKSERPDAPRLDAFDWAFARLLRYRCDAERLLCTNKGVTGGGNGALYAAHILTEATNERVRAEVAPIDAVLCAFLDPEERAFTLEELIENGYPDDDLSQIEMDEF